MTVKLRVTKEMVLPNPVQLDRFRRIPELGPKILFFSGGSALYKASRSLLEYTHNSIHIITPFDSGGSSARLRDEFDMPAVGDIRHRIMALADQSYHGNPEIFELFSFRLPKDLAQVELRHMLEQMAAGKHTLVKKIPNPMRKLIRTHLQKFLEFVSERFDFKGASIGNLMLAAGYLDNRRHMDPVIYLLSKLVEVRGTVRPIVNSSYQLVVQLEDGSKLVGQHTFSGKEGGRIKSKIVSMDLVRKATDERFTTVTIRQKNADLIRSAELICYPMGSFYSSVLATVMPSGIGKAIAQNGCPKVYIPNTGDDPESIGLSLTEQVDRLIEYIGRGERKTVAPSEVLTIVLLDQNAQRYAGSLSLQKLADLGIQVVRCPLVCPKTEPYIDERKLIPVLLSLC